MFSTVTLFACMSSLVAYPVKVDIPVGGCFSTLYGCCDDKLTPCVYANCSNCNVTKEVFGGCVGTLYGCCDDELTPCVYANCSNCFDYNETIVSNNTKVYVIDIIGDELIYNM